MAEPAEGEDPKYRRVVVLVHTDVYARLEARAKTEHHKVGPWIKLAIDEKLRTYAQKR